MITNHPEFPPDLKVTTAPATIGDAADLARIFNEIGEADGTPERLSVESMEHELTAYFDPPEERTLVVRDETGTIVGFATTYNRPSESAEARAYVNLHVAVDRRNKGLEEPMMEWAIEAATAAVRDLPAERRFVCAWMYKKQKKASARFERRGFEAVRHWWEMERMLDEEISEPSCEGFDLIPWEEVHDEPARLVYNEAFADHWGSTPMSEDDWAKHIVGSPHFRREFSFVVVGDGEVVGYSSCEEYPEDSEAAGRREVWVGSLGVLREWRKRGIASALLAANMAAMKAGGVEAAMIGVDSDSPSGAQHLYTSVGFETNITATTWQLEVG